MSERLYHVRIDHGTVVHNVAVRARDVDDAFTRALAVLKLEDKNVEGVITPVED